MCRKTSELSNIGRTALFDHQLGKTHIENVKKIRSFFSTKKATAASLALDTHLTAVTYASVDNAEIRWALKYVMAGYSNNSNRGVWFNRGVSMSDLFPVMFADSPAAAKYQLRYSINFGLGLFFNENLCRMFKTLIITT